MATKWSDVVIECPYYHSMDDRGGKSYIVCEGTNEYSCMLMMFLTGEARKTHVKRYCASERWQCPACMSLDFFHDIQEKGEL